MIHRLMNMMEMGVEWVLYLLLALSVLTLALALERVWFLFRRRGRRPGLRPLVPALLRGETEAGARVRTEQSVPARVLAAMLDHRDLSPEALQEVVDGVLLEQRGDLEKRLDFFATVGSNAPFIGLFGTVLGIVRAFADLASAETTGPQVVMAGISEALVATAVGLGVAIPALVLFNLFKGQTRNTLREAEALSKIVMADRVERAVAALAAPNAPDAPYQPLAEVNSHDS